ncbi:MAG: UDP-N-acetylglucosamine--N-acetylmuramyl-(pentapeptide) pyrophosphoryl-undecaprenol N-acetylglucosamine transferase [Candidatus Doudnabacteria bacterium]|nr:UDP-N-acetylglucosamine--N-acetylmuramyl-(pentapeptide) pyrophosphoryl-undecaprenol N-acetylglucosamine transferase [Candidatus Doudnabacteria bacterium]
MNQLSKRIILIGGGSGGPVAPLLAVASELKKIDSSIEFLFVGTKQGPERQLVENVGIRFISIPAAKFRRYFSLSNFTDIFVFIYSLWRARKIIEEFKPNLVFGAGGYVALPISWMGWLAKSKVVLHQQDARIGLANRLISPVADLITTAFEKTSKDFSSGSGLGKKPLKPSAQWVGNPVRQEFFTPLNPDAKKKFSLDDFLPVLLVTGGGTGSTQINDVVSESLPELVNTHQVIHVTGAGKNNSTFKHRNYHPYEFLTADFPDAMKLADVVIARAGLSTISELSVLGKISVIVPMHESHQEDNADILRDRAAAVVLDKSEFSAQDLPRIVKSLKFNVGRQKLLSENIRNLMPHNAAERIAQLISETLK